MYKYGIGSRLFICCWWHERCCCYCCCVDQVGLLAKHNRTGLDPADAFFFCVRFSFGWCSMGFCHLKPSTCLLFCCTWDTPLYRHHRCRALFHRVPGHSSARIYYLSPDLNATTSYLFDADTMFRQSSLRWPNVVLIYFWILFWLD